MKLLAAIATLAAGIGSWFWRGRDKGIQAPSKFRGQVKRSMDEIERTSGMKFKHDNIRMRTMRADRLDGDLPVYYSDIHGKEIGGHSRDDSNFTLAEHNSEIHGGALKHELWHILCWQHKIPVEEHHALMRKHGVYGA